MSHWHLTYEDSNVQLILLTKALSYLVLFNSVKGIIILLVSEAKMWAHPFAFLEILMVPSF